MSLLLSSIECLFSQMGLWHLTILSRTCRNLHKRVNDYAAYQSGRKELEGLQSYDPNSALCCRTLRTGDTKMLAHLMEKLQDIRTLSKHIVLFAPGRQTCQDLLEVYIRGLVRRKDTLVPGSNYLEDALYAAARLGDLPLSTWLWEKWHVEPLVGQLECDLVVAKAIKSGNQDLVYAALKFFTSNAGIAQALICGPIDLVKHIFMLMGMDRANNFWEETFAFGWKDLLRLKDEIVEFLIEWGCEMMCRRFLEACIRATSWMDLCNDEAIDLVLKKLEHLHNLILSRWPTLSLGSSFDMPHLPPFSNPHVIKFFLQRGIPYNERLLGIAIMCPQRQYVVKRHTCNSSTLVTMHDVPLTHVCRLCWELIEWLVEMGHVNWNQVRTETIRKGRTGMLDSVGTKRRKISSNIL